MLDAPKCWVMNEKGIVSDKQRGVESHEIGGKIGKNKEREHTHQQQSGKAKRCKMHRLFSFFTKQHLRNKGKVCLLWA